MGLYISLNRTVDQIRNLGLDKICPTRKAKGGNTPMITASGRAYKREDRFKPWNAAEAIPSQQQQRMMFKEALWVGLEIVMRNHVCGFDNCIRQQQKGEPIGLELTENIIQVFMIWWDATNSPNFLTRFLFPTTLSSLEESLNPSAQSDNNLTIVDQVIVLGALVGSLRYSSGVSGVYFVNLCSFTPLPL